MTTNMAGAVAMKRSRRTVAEMKATVAAIND